MSRGQSTQAFNTSSNENATDFGNAQSAFGSTENALGDYKNQLAKFVSSNPYVSGGEYDKSITTGLANVSDAGANSLAGALAQTALRTGQNSASNAATAATAAQQNTRDLSANLADAEQKRIAGEAGYNTTGLNATQVPIGANQALYGTSTGAAGGTLNTEEGAAQTPSFWDEVGKDVAGGLGGALSKGYSANGSGGTTVCWVAAELYGGWYDPRTILVRTWMHGSFSRHTLGRIVVALYARFGERTAEAIRRHPLLRSVFLPLFNAALSRARGD